MTKHVSNMVFKCFFLFLLPMQVFAYLLGYWLSGSLILGNLFDHRVGISTLKQALKVLLGLQYTCIDRKMDLLQKSLRRHLSASPAFEQGIHRHHHASSSSLIQVKQLGSTLGGYWVMVELFFQELSRSSSKLRQQSFYSRFWSSH